MAIRMLMSWVPSRKRWAKKYRGKMYAVSCSALGVPETKDASWRAANAWWEKKRAELDAAKVPTTALASSLAALAAMDVYRETGTLPRSVQVEGHGVPPTRVNIPAHLQAEGEALAAPVLAALDRMTADAPTGSTVGGRAQEWYAALRSGKGVARYATYRRNLEVFLEHVGRSTPIDNLDSFTLERWHSTLKDRITAGQYSSDYARTLYGASKKFLKWLAGHGLIPLPGNFDSTDLRFEPGNRIHDDVGRLFTNDEIRTVLGAASPRMKLFLLLMLNCGYYQSDVSDLTEDEVDWEAGVIERVRSKIKKKGVVVRHKLWPETFALLQAHRQVGAPVLDDLGRRRVLTTDDHKPLQAYWIEDGQDRRYDTINSLWSTLKRKTGINKALKDLRKTSANRLHEHEIYGRYTQHFLGHVPSDVVGQHYVLAPSDAKFFPALEWLGRDLGLLVDSAARDSSD